MPSLSIGAGALIQADPLANISLASNIRIIEDGTLRAPGGTISLSSGRESGGIRYDDTQAIWLGPQAVLDAAGVPQILSE